MLTLVVHVPNASIAIPDDAWTEFLSLWAAVQAEALVAADLHSDEMAEVGRGVFYACDHQIRPIRNALIEVRRDVVGVPSGGSKWQRLTAALSTIPIGV